MSDMPPICEAGRTTSLLGPPESNKSAQLKPETAERNTPASRPPGTGTAFALGRKLPRVPSQSGTNNSEPHRAGTKPTGNTISSAATAKQSPLPVPDQARWREQPCGVAAGAEAKVVVDEVLYPSLAKEIKDWLSKPIHRSAAAIASALADNDPYLKDMSELQKRFLVASVLDPKLDPAPWLPINPDALVALVKDNNRVHGVVVKEFMDRAVELESTARDSHADGAHSRAQRYISLAFAILHTTQDDELGLRLDKNYELGTRIAHAPSEQYVELLTRILNGDQRIQLLSALYREPRTTATHAAVRQLLAELSPDRPREIKEIAYWLSSELAKPDWPEAGRIQDLMVSPQGARLLFTGSAQWREFIVDIIRVNREVTNQFLAQHDGDPLMSESVIRGIANALLSKHVNELGLKDLNGLDRQNVVGSVAEFLRKDGYWKIAINSMNPDAIMAPIVKFIIASSHPRMIAEPVSPYSTELFPYHRQ
jgi:hypothetical protein